MVVAHPDQVHQVRARFWRSQVGHDRLPLRHRKEPRRHLGRHVRRPARALDRPPRRVGRLHAIEQVAQFHREGQTLGRGGVVLGGRRRLHRAALGVEEEVGGIQRAVVLPSRLRLRHEELTCAHDLGLQRQLLERRDETRRLKHGTDRRAHVAREIGLFPEKHLGHVVDAVHVARGRREDAILAAVPRLPLATPRQRVGVDVRNDRNEVDRLVAHVHQSFALRHVVNAVCDDVRPRLRLLGSFFARVVRRTALLRVPALALLRLTRALGRAHGLLAQPSQPGKRRRALILDAHDAEPKHQERVDDVACKRYPAHRGVGKGCDVRRSPRFKGTVHTTCLPGTAQTRPAAARRCPRGARPPRS